MDIKKMVAIILLLSAVGFFWVEIFFTMKETNALTLKNADLTGRLQAMSLERDKIAEDISYYSNPLNLAKLLKEKFNFKEPSEKMIIVVPQ